MRNFLLVAVALAAPLAGCGNQTLVAGLFVNTPAVTLPSPAPGVAPMTYGPYTALLGYLSSIDTSQLTELSSASITGIAGAQAQVVFESCLGVTDPAANAACVSSGHGGTDRVFTVPDQGGGLYELLSTDQPELSFETGVTYTLILQVPDGSGTDAYGARFQPGPPAHMVEFTDPSSGQPQAVTLAAGSALTVHRDDAKVDGQYLPAAVLVRQIDPNNPAAMPPIVWKSSTTPIPRRWRCWCSATSPTAWITSTSAIR